jgi:hypothetical protein
MHSYMNSLSLFLPIASKEMEMESESDCSSDENEVTIRETLFESVYGYRRTICIENKLKGPQILPITVTLISN